MLTQQSIRDFLAQSDYDIRESGNGRWIDQKCTPDVVCAVADFICNYVADDPSPESYVFTSKEIWHSEYASQYVEAVFKKPAPKNKNAKHEYDKFFSAAHGTAGLCKCAWQTKNKGQKLLLGQTNQYFGIHCSTRTKCSHIFKALYRKGSP